MEKDNQKKTVFQRLKRLMTVTEKDVVEEKERERKKLKEAPPIEDSEIKDNTEELKEELVEKKRKKPFLKIVKNEPQLDDDENRVFDEKEISVENEDDVELIGNHEHNIQKNSRKLNENEDDVEQSKEDENNKGNISESDDLEKKPRKKGKSFINSVFKIGQALNAKPDEFVSDDELSDIIKDDDINLDENNPDVPQEVTDENQENQGSEVSPPPKKEYKSAPFIEDIDMSFVKVQKVNGNIFIENNIEPMYTIETADIELNIEIGKLTPILMDAYEEYLEPDVLKAKREEENKKRAAVNDEDIITKATTAFGGIEESSKDYEKIFENTTNSRIKSDKKEEPVEEMEKSTLPNLTEKEKKKLEKEKLKEEKRQNKAKEKELKREARKNRSFRDRLLYGYNTTIDYNKFSTDNESFEKIEDYERPQDARDVMVEINTNIRKQLLRTIVTSIVFVFALVLVICQKFFISFIDSIIPNADVFYCIATLVLLAICVGVCGITVKNGLIPLISFDGNSDTPVAVASVAAIIQCIVSLFDTKLFYSGVQSLYAVMVMFSLALNSLGKMIMVLRIKDNFRFVACDRKKYAVTIFNEKKISEKMVRGTNAAGSTVVYQRPTNFYKNFLKLSYSQDISEEKVAKISRVSLICSIVLAIVNGIVFKNVISAFSTFAMVSCISIPSACLLSVNIPIKMLCKKVLRNDAMIVGYPAIAQFEEASAVMVDSKELYPRSTVELVGIKPYVPQEALKIELLNAAAVLKVVNTSLTYVFSDLIDKKDTELPYVDSVKFEEGKGIVGWIGGERVLIGRRNLFKAYGVALPPEKDEKQFRDEQRNITYIANAGRLLAMVVTSYSFDDKIKEEMKNLEKNGVSILVRTVDPNLTAKRIASDYGIHENSVKILPNSLGKICREVVTEKGRRARCYIGTRGKFVSLAKALSGCIKIKSNISIAVIVQMIGVVLGIIISAFVALFASEQGMGVFELLCFMAFWTVASIIAPIIKKL